MQVLVILAHPNKTSFNHAIAATVIHTLVKSGHDAVFHDLYAEGFDPLLPGGEIPDAGPVTALIEHHCREVRSAGGLVFVHPNWWGQPPAVLTGWIDRVLRPGVAYKFDENDNGEGVPLGLLRGKTGIVFNTSNTPAEREHDFFGDPLDLIWKKCIFEFCGIERYSRKTFSVVVTSTERQRQQWLDETAGIVRHFFPGDTEKN